MDWMVTCASMSFDIPWGQWIHEPAFYIPAAIGLAAFLVFLGVAISRMPSAYRARKGGVLDALQLEEIMPGQRPVVLDLRSREEYFGKGGRIRASLSTPLPELNDHIEEIRKEAKGRPIVLVDETDKLSHLARPILEAHGFTWIYVLKGGLRAWRASTFPMVQGKP